MHAGQPRTPPALPHRRLWAAQSARAASQSLVVVAVGVRGLRVMSSTRNTSCEIGQRWGPGLGPGTSWLRWRHSFFPYVGSASRYPLNSLQ